MCGIAGIVAQQVFDCRLLQQMGDTLRHRGPDDEGFAIVGENAQLLAHRGKETVSELARLPRFTDGQQCRIGLVHRRLSILDLSELGHQPVLSADGQRALVFNGEIYNYKELRAELISKKIEFQSDSDTEVVFHALAHWGTSAFERFRGMWALAWLDMEKRELILSRDRFGIKPLYFSDFNGKLAFASEIKALLETGLMPPKVERDKLFEYLAFGALSRPFDEPYTHLKSVEPGTFLTVDIESSRRTATRYYHIEARVAEAKQNLPDAESFAKAFEESIKLHLRSDVPVGACLSGGLDSSAIVAAAAGQHPDQPFHTFTAAFPGNAVDESQYAKMVTDQFPNIQPHLVYPQAEGFSEDLDRLIHAQDLPMGSTSVFAQWEVMKLAHSRGMKVLLDGQGADEILGGYYNFAGLRLIGLLRRFQPGAFLREYRALKENFTPKINTAIGRAGYYYLPEWMQRRVRSQTRQGSHLIAPEYFKNWDMPVPARGGRDFESHALLSLQYGLYELLRYEDRNSMAFSIESRVPFLDHPLVECILAMPESEKMNNGWTKYPVRRYLQNRVPGAITWRKDKLGFVTPQSDWKNQLAPKLSEYLKHFDYPEELNASYFQSLAQQTLTDNTHLSEFWRAYSVLRWMEGNGVEF